MTQLPTMRELQPLAKPARRRVLRTTWDRLVATITNPDLVMVAIFCAIGLLITVNMILRFSEFGAIAEQFQQFP